MSIKKTRAKSQLGNINVICQAEATGENEHSPYCTVIIHRETTFS